MKAFAFIRARQGGTWYILWKPKSYSNPDAAVSGTVLECVFPLWEEPYLASNFHTDLWEVFEYDTQEELILAHIDEIL